MLTTMVENCPGHRDGIMGPGPDGRDAGAGGAVRRRDHPGARHASISARTPFVVRRRDAEYTAQIAHHRDRRVGAAARAAVGTNADGPRRFDVRDVRRLLLPRSGDRCRRRRRLGDGGSDLSDAIREQGDARPPARHAARVEDHAGQSARELQDRMAPQFGGGRDSGFRARAK